MKQIMVDPPSGWMYGFPLPYDAKKDGDLGEFFAKNGYPKEEIDFALRHTRFWKPEISTDREANINKFEYELLTNTWTGPKGAAFNACFEFCTERGYMTGLNHDGNPMVTTKGREQIAQFEKNSKESS